MKIGYLSAERGGEGSFIIRHADIAERTFLSVVRVVLLAVSRLVRSADKLSFWDAIGGVWGAVVDKFIGQDKAQCFGGFARRGIVCRLVTIDFGKAALGKNIAENSGAGLGGIALTVVVFVDMEAQLG